MAYILSIGRASPDNCFQQEIVGEKLIKGLGLSGEEEEKVRRLYLNSSIQTRYSVLEDLNYLLSKPSTKQRNEIYKKEAPKLAIKATKRALEACRYSPSQITHVISVSCTGMMVPGIEYYVIKELGLNPSVGRIAINFMGCFGAFNALSVATALIRENVDHRVLIVCTELCSLHGQMDLSTDNLSAHALFADGAGAAIIGGSKNEEFLWEIFKRSSIVLDNSSHIMSWESGDTGYLMKLSNRVPILIREHIYPFCDNLVREICSFDACHWAIHPGGKSIIQVIEKKCALLPSQTTSSWEVLKEYGNMSSATFLFVLEKALQKKQGWTLGVGFGPGLAMEGIVLRCSGKQDQ